MPFTGNEGTIISPPQAKTMITNYQNSPSFQNLKGGFYGKNKILAILNQANCVGIRYYHAHNASNQPVIVLVGEDNAGNNLSSGVLINDGPLCPPFCPTSNALDA